MPIINSLTKQSKKTIEQLYFEPSTSMQVVDATESVAGYAPVTVMPVTSSIDANITAGNIKDGVSILGVTGSVVELNAQSVRVYPSTSVQLISATSPYNALSLVQVDGVTSSIDQNIVAGNIKNGVTILGVTGDYTGSQTAVIDPLTVTPTTSQQVINATASVDGYAPVTVNAVTSSIDANIAAENIVSGVSILGVSGSATVLNGETQSVSITSTAGNTFTPTTGKNAITSITVTPTNYDRGVSASTTTRTFAVPAGYSGHGTITVNPVDASIDANIQAGNIKSGVTILGVTGTYGGGAGANVEKVVRSGVLRNSKQMIDLTGVDEIGDSALAYAYADTAYDATTMAVSFSPVTKISGDYACYYAFNHSMVVSVDMSTVEEITGMQACAYMFAQDTGITSVNLSGLKLITGSSACQYMFSGCSGITSVVFTLLNTVSSFSAMWGMFENCTSLTSISFPALTSSSFGTNTNQFHYMLHGVTGCTVHFPSNLQSIIGSWADVSAGFGGTNTTVLFDLPATA